MRKAVISILTVTYVPTEQTQAEDLPARCDGGQSMENPPLELPRNFAICPQDPRFAGPPWFDR